MPLVREQEKQAEISCLWQEGDSSQLQGLEDVEQASHNLRVVARHGRIPECSHQSIDGHSGVILLAAGHQPRGAEQVPAQVILGHCTCTIKTLLRVFQANITDPGPWMFRTAGSIR